jgi:ABC-2 type transport system permease protein
MAETFWWPSFDLFIWGLMTVYLQRQQGVADIILTFFLSAIILWMFVYRSQQEIGISFLRDVWDRNLLNILTTPITIWELLTGLLFLGVIRLVASTLWMLLLAYILFQFNFFVLGFYLIPFVVNLLLFGWNAGLIINGLIFRYGYRVQAFAWTLILIVQPFSAVFYPVESLPTWMQWVAKILPTSYIFEGMRTVLVTKSIDTIQLLIATVLNVIYLGVALWFFNESYKKAQETGMIVKLS